MLRIIVSFMLIFALSGCSLFAPNTQTITVSTSPSNADVRVNGMLHKSPMAIPVSRKSGLNLRVSKNGYEDVVMYVDYGLSTCGVLDIIGGVIFLVPLIGLVSDGAYKLNQTNFDIVLTPKE